MRLPWKDRPGHAVAWKIHSRPSGAARWCINTIPFNRRPSSAPIPSSSRDRRSKSLDCLVNVMRTLEELCQIQPLARYNTMATLDRSSSTVVPAPIRPTCVKVFLVLMWTKSWNLISVFETSTCSSFILTLSYIHLYNKCYMCTLDRTRKRECGSFLQLPTCTRIRTCYTNGRAPSAYGHWREI